MEMDIIFPIASARVFDWQLRKLRHFVDLKVNKVREGYA